MSTGGTDYAPVATNGSKAKDSGTVEQMKPGDGEKEGVGLKATMGLASGCNIIIGCIIGSGIFVSPGGVLGKVGSINLALVIWTLSGIYSMIGAYCYAELGLLMKSSGGDYTYIHRTFGPFVAFIRLWAECLIVRPCTVAIVALTFAKYVTKPFFPECDPPDDSVRMLAAMCICKCKKFYEDFFHFWFESSLDHKNDCLEVL